MKNRIKAFIALTLTGSLSVAWFLRPASENPAIALAQSVRNSRMLVTAIATKQIVMPVTRAGNLLGIPTQSGLTYVAVGEVSAGVDLVSVSPADIEVEGKTVRVRLPAPTILSSKIDVGASRVLNADRGFLNLGPDTTGLQTEAEQVALKQMVDAAETDGLLLRAQGQAEIVMRDLFQGAGFDDVTVEFR